MSAAAVIFMRIKKIFAFLRNRQAFSPATAVPLSEVPYSDRWYFRRLIRRDVVKLHEGNCYLDEPGVQRYLKRRRIRMVIFLGAVSLAAFLYIVLKH
jgi:hypothetical protein